MFLTTSRKEHVDAPLLVAPQCWNTTDGAHSLLNGDIEERWKVRCTTHTAGIKVDKLRLQALKIQLADIDYHGEDIETVYFELRRGTDINRADANYWSDIAPAFTKLDVYAVCNDGGGWEVASLESEDVERVRTVECSFLCGGLHVSDAYL